MKLQTSHQEDPLGEETYDVGKEEQVPREAAGVGWQENQKLQPSSGPGSALTTCVTGAILGLTVPAHRPHKAIRSNNFMMQRCFEQCKT